MSQSLHSAGTLTSSSLGLDAPIVASNLAAGVASRSASLLLLVPVLLATVARQRMRLVAAFSLSLSSLRLNNKNSIVSNCQITGLQRTKTQTAVYAHRVAIRSHNHLP